MNQPIELTDAQRDHIIQWFVSHLPTGADATNAIAGLNRENPAPYVRELERLVPNLHARAREAGLNPDQEEDLIEWALMMAVKQANMVFDAGLFRMQREERDWKY